jgi:AbiJ N-terminal domain 4
MPFMPDTFSRRQGYVKDPPITVREAAPTRIREDFVELATSSGGLTYHGLWNCFRSADRGLPDLGRMLGSAVKGEIKKYVDSREWFHFYDLCESVGTYHPNKHAFVYKLNERFIEQGIGWKLEDGRIVSRESAELEDAVQVAEVALKTAGVLTAEAELRKAREDLSRRPTADLSGAIQHCLASLECLSRKLSGNDTATLGMILKSKATELAIPKPLDVAVEKMWGYASEMGRHLQDGREPAREEVELVVVICAGLMSYLMRKIA